MNIVYASHPLCYKKNDTLFMDYDMNNTVISDMFSLYP